LVRTYSNFFQLAIDNYQLPIKYYANPPNFIRCCPLNYQFLFEVDAQGLAEIYHKVNTDKLAADRRMEHKESHS